jgi:hypothetical protein
MCKSKNEISPKVAENLISEINRLKAKLDIAPRVAVKGNPDSQMVEVSRTGFEDALDWMAFIIHRCSETPEERENRDLEREQESNYNRGLGI